MEKTIYQMLKRDTKDYTVDDISDEIKQCKIFLKSEGFNKFHGDKGMEVVKFNLKSPRILGQCGYRAYGAEFNFNPTYFKIADKLAVHSTIMHEVIHSVVGCENHRTKFQMLAKLANYKLGLKVATQTTDMAYAQHLQKIKEVKSKYQITCKGCGHIYYKQRMSKSIDLMIKLEGKPSPYFKCPYCGGNAFDVKINH